MRCFLLARMQKKIKKNIKAQSELKEKNTPKPRVKEKVGKDYLLVAVIAFTIMVTIAGWSALENLNRALYVLLITSLSLTYIRRHFNLTEQQETWVDRGSIVSMGFALSIFAVIMYYQIFT